MSPIRSRTLAAAVFATLAAAQATRAEVVEVSETGFTAKEAVTVSVPPEKAYAAFVAIGKWWDPAHTYSGDAANLSIDPKPQGCFCERLSDGGGVRHMTVVFVSPGKRLALEGGLGPLQSMGVTGSMTLTFAPAEKGTTVTLRYVVGGHNAGGFQEISAGVEAVLRAQLERYRAYADPVKLSGAGGAPRDCRLEPRCIHLSFRGRQAEESQTSMPWRGSCRVWDPSLSLGMTALGKACEPAHTFFSAPC